MRKLFASAFLLATLCVSLTFSQKYATNDIEEEDSETYDYVHQMESVRRVSGRQCGQNKCLVMGMQRFSEPFCDSLGGEGATCRPGQEADNKTLVFPNGLLEVEEVYLQFCPCDGSLVCHEAECTRPEVVEKLEQQERQRQAQLRRRNRFRQWTMARMMH